ncbi:hypothetical protein KEJ19_02580 [Candidatus Bathyarchaeota archaeon]|nr:hypothetical protein [Candidatus Bathyarchaeota archaeon]
MEYSNVLKESIKEGSKVYGSILLELENALIVLLYEGEKARLGTLAISIPGIQGGSSSSILLGGESIVSARVMAERISQRTGKVGLLSIFSRTDLDKTGGLRAYSRLLEDLLDKKAKASEG